MKYKIILSGFGYRVNTHKVSKKTFNSLREEYEKEILAESEILPSLDERFEKILGIENIWDIFWGGTDTFLDGGDPLGIYNPYLEIKDLKGNKIFSEEINIGPFIDKLFHRFGLHTTIKFEANCGKILNNHFQASS